jgi:uncharacterized protein YbjT (DUF2867 family)
VSAIDTRDVSAIAAKVILEAGHAGRRYELTGPESLSNDDIARLFSEALGRKITHVSIPEAQATAAMIASGLPAWLVGLLTELNAIAKAGGLAEVKPDAAQILQRPPITFARFLQDHLATFKS